MAATENATPWAVAALLTPSPEATPGAAPLVSALAKSMQKTPTTRARLGGAFESTAAAAELDAEAAVARGRGSSAALHEAAARILRAAYAPEEAGETPLAHQGAPPRALVGVLISAHRTLAAIDEVGGDSVDKGDAAMTASEGSHLTGTLLTRLWGAADADAALYRGWEAAWEVRAEEGRDAARSIGSGREFEIDSATVFAAEQGSANPAGALLGVAVVEAEVALRGVAAAAVTAAITPPRLLANGVMGLAQHVGTGAIPLHLAALHGPGPVVDGIAGAVVRVLATLLRGAPQIGGDGVGVGGVEEGGGAAPLACAPEFYDLVGSLKAAEDRGSETAYKSEREPGVWGRQRGRTSPAPNGEWEEAIYAVALAEENMRAARATEKEAPMGAFAPGTEATEEWRIVAACLHVATIVHLAWARACVATCATPYVEPAPTITDLMAEGCYDVEKKAWGPSAAGTIEAAGASVALGAALSVGTPKDPVLMPGMAEEVLLGVAPDPAVFRALFRATAVAETAEDEYEGGGDEGGVPLLPPAPPAELAGELLILGPASVTVGRACADMLDEFVGALVAPV